MKKGRGNDRVNEMRKEYDFRDGVRGKYAARVRQGTNIVVLDPDVAKAFPDSRAVNRALRALLKAPRRDSRGRRG
jgi:hypothetical protein